MSGLLNLSGSPVLLFVLSNADRIRITLTALLGS